MDSATDKVVIRIDPRYFRPTEVDVLLGDPSKAVTLLGWDPKRTSFTKLVEEMVESDISVLEKGGSGLNEQVPDAFTPGVSPQ